MSLVPMTLVPMTLAGALRKGREDRSGGEPYRVRLAFGATPLHLATFLRAHLLEALPGRDVTVRTGVFGDAAGAIEGDAAEAVAVAIEWADFDPRLDVREQRSWAPLELADAVASAAERAVVLMEKLRMAAGGASVALCGPTLPLPPAFWTPAAQASGVELRLRATVAAFLADAAALDGIRVVAPDAVGGGDLDERVDPASWLGAGLPYSLAHADRVAGLLAAVLAPRPPKKGLITDLDDTVWKGLVGEVGPGAVAWDLDGRARLHGLYQQTLASLAAQGVLLAVASKNDEAPALAALERADAVIGRDAFFPIEVGWGPKSASVSRILEAWNIAADSVVFVDDSPFELAEVEKTHPGIACELFPKKSPREALALLRRLRDRFGKSTIEAEDALRLDSLRSAARLRRAAGSSTDAGEELLRSLDARLLLDWRPRGSRPLELINKTNQFNLNGVRRTEHDWRARLDDPDAVALAVGYQDKFGPLGVIAVAAGRRVASELRIDSWVMSCRAFSRRIEHRTLQALFERVEVDRISLEYAPTDRNGPLQRLLAELADASLDDPGLVSISRVEFERRCPALYQQVEDQTPSD